MVNTVFIASIVVLTMLFTSCKTMPAVELRPAETIEVEPTTKPPMFSAELANYPITDKFLKNAEQLMTEYKLRQEYHLLHISANFTDTLEGQSEDEACRVADQYIVNHLQPKKEITDTCTPTYSCDYDSARFPATLIKVTCPRMKCIDENLYRGACLSMNSDLTYLHFREELRSEPDTIAGSGDEPTVRKGLWYYHTVTLTTDCYCSDGK